MMKKRQMIKVANAKERTYSRFLNALRNDNRFKTIYLDWCLHKEHFVSFRSAYKAYYNGVMGGRVPFLEGWRKLQELLEKVNNLLSKGKEVEL